MHVGLGCAATFLTILAVASGPLALVQKPDGGGGSTPIEQWALANAAACCTALMLVCVFLTLWEATRAQLAAMKLAASD